MYKTLVLTYESATTRLGRLRVVLNGWSNYVTLMLFFFKYRLYYEGRTETIRPVSEKSKAFVEVRGLFQCSALREGGERRSSIMEISGLPFSSQAMDDPKVPRDVVKRLFKEAIL